MSFLLLHPLISLSFFSLAMGLFSLWIHKSSWIFGSFALISLVMAFTSDLLSWMALIPLSFFSILLASLTLNPQGLARFLIASTLFLIGGALFFHIFPGFFPVQHHCFFSSSFCCNYAKGLVALLLLGWFVPTLKAKEVFKSAMPMSLVSATLLLILFFIWKMPIWNPFFSLSFFHWALFTLFFIILPEEALLRGLLQKELFQWLGGGVKSHVSCLIIASCIYPLFHLGWEGNFSLLLPTMLAGFTYALLYQISRKIEMSILCHFFIQCGQFLLFHGSETMI